MNDSKNSGLRRLLFLVFLLTAQMGGAQVPNGNPKFNLDDEEAYFRPIGEAIAQFASTHNLVLDKYFHEFRAWDLRFRHPKGGDASISVARDSDEFVRISATWYEDDYDTFTRYIFRSKVRKVAKNSHDVAEALRDELAQLVEIEKGNWTQIAKGYEAIWGETTKAEFENMRPDLPNPVLDRQ